MKLAILIPTLVAREHLFRRVSDELGRQIDEIYPHSLPGEIVSILQLADSGQYTTGNKRNALIELAVKEYKPEGIAFMDDDDMPGPTYIKRGLEFIESGMDCAELWGQIYWNGKPGKPFHHSIEHKEWYEDEKYYYRCPNHLNFMRLDKVKDFKFPDQNFGEDGQWSMAIKEAGVLKTQFVIPEVIYHYFNGEPKLAL